MPKGRAPTTQPITKVGARLDRAREWVDMGSMITGNRRRTERLHAGRISIPGELYFVTIVTADRKAWLSEPEAARGMLEVLREWHAECDGAILVATVMPDHVHVLCTLGERLDLGRCVSRWKAQGRKAVGYSGGWQRDFWERRVREDESIEDYGLYVLLNPYRAGFVAPHDAWPWFLMPDRSIFRFGEMLDPRGAPPADWVDWPADRFAGLATGE